MPLNSFKKQKTVFSVKEHIMLQSVIVNNILELSENGFNPGATYYISCCKTGSVCLRDTIQSNCIDISSLHSGIYKFTCIIGDDIKHCNFEKN